MPTRRIILKLAAASALSSQQPLALGMTNSQQQHVAGSLSTPLYDELYYVGKPDLYKFGLSPIHVAYTWQLWGEKSFDGIMEHEPPIASLENYIDRYNLRSKPPALFVLDIEHWKHYGDISKKTLNKNIDKYIRCIDTIRKSFPKTTKFSLYNIGPQPNFGRLESRELNQKEKRKWMASNDLTLPMVEHMDFLTPSLYFKKQHSYEDWERKAKYFLDEAKRLGGNKPVIPFIWPQYSNVLPLTELPGSVWAKILKFSAENSDGVILWRRHKGPLASKWNPKADWWKETLRYIDQDLEEKSSTDMRP